MKFEKLSLNQKIRAGIKNQAPMCLWLTGLSGSGKSTLANGLEQKLNQLGKHTYILDGDNLRHGLNSNLGFTKDDRNENVRRTAETAKLMVNAGIIVIVAIISPFKKGRELAYSLFKKNQFKEIYISTSLTECEHRDVKGLYGKARKGDIRNFTGIDSTYEPPENPEVNIDTQNKSVEDCVQYILQKIYIQ